MNDYSEVAAGQLDALERVGGAAWDAICDALELIFGDPGRARAFSTAITTRERLVLQLPVPGAEPLKIFWTSDEPRVEAVFPYGGVS